MEKNKQNSDRYVLRFFLSLLEIYFWVKTAISLTLKLL